MSFWTRPCACGLDVTANPDDPTPGVRAHNATPEHRRWRRRREAIERTAIWRLQLREDVEMVRLKAWARGAAA